MPKRVFITRGKGKFVINKRNKESKMKLMRMILRQGSLNCCYGPGPAPHALNPISEEF